MNQKLLRHNFMKGLNVITFIMCGFITLLGGGSAYADDTEIFFSQTATSSSPIPPNILLIVDASQNQNSSSSSSSSSSNPESGCDQDKIYFWSSPNKPNSCNASGLFRVDASKLKCTAAITPINNGGTFSAAKFMFLNQGTNNKYYWSLTPNSTTQFIECNIDIETGSPITNPVLDGYTENDGLFPQKGTAINSVDAGAWTSTNSQKFDYSGSASSYYLFTGNYIDGVTLPPCLYQATTDPVSQAVTELFCTLASSYMNVGLMAENDKQSNKKGGSVIQPIQLLTSTNKSTYIAAANNLPSPGNISHSETLYEAYQYLSGKSVFYGKPPNGNSISSSWTGSSLANGTYTSPLGNNTSQCNVSNNHVVYITDRVTNGTTDAWDEINALTGSNSLTLTGDVCGNNQDEVCLAKLSDYMYQNNLISSAASKVKTHVIAFGPNISSTTGINNLKLASEELGGGLFKAADNVAELKSGLREVFSRIVADTSATFVTPSVAVNSFNKTQVLEDLYVAMFKPSNNTHWDGNLKKFKIREVTSSSSSASLTIVGKDTTTSAIDENSGFFKTTTQDFWQSSSDTNKDTTTKGGAANLLPNPNLAPKRSVYTYTGSNTPTSAQALSSFDTSNSDLKTIISNSIDSTNLLDTSLCNSKTTCTNVLINWTRGDTDGDGSSGEADLRKRMGDPIHSQPAVVIYGNGSNTTDKVNDALVFVATNDGFLHAIDVVSGVEKWSYIPKDILPDLKNIFINDYAEEKHYSLDGDLRVLRYDTNNNGVIEPTNNDRVILYFSQGRGGATYYALDVTDKTNPKFLWSLDKTALSNIVDKSWSAPTLGRINVSGAAQNSQKLVLIFGGGYDNSEDSKSPTSGKTSGNTYYGNGLFIIDAIKGTVLWRAGYTSSGANLILSDMTHAIPSNVTILDTDNDEYTDRMYVGDMAGQIWRFDITNGNSASTLVSGGVIASLGAKAETSPSISNNRSLYNAPDVAKMSVLGGSNYYNIAIGSGDRGLPKSNTTTQDRFYSIRDYNIGPMTQTQYDNYTKIKDSDLTTTTGTTAPDTMGINGWKLELSASEKVLSQSVTQNGTVLFTSFIPTTSLSVCAITTGKSRSYIMNVKSASKFSTTLYETFNTTGLPTQIMIIPPKDKIIRTDGTTASSSSSSSSGTTASSTKTGTCLSGVSILGKCVEFGARVKTVWSDSVIN